MGGVGGWVGGWVGGLTYLGGVGGLEVLDVSEEEGLEDGGGGWVGGWLVGGAEGRAGEVLEEVVVVEEEGEVGGFRVLGFGEVVDALWEWVGGWVGGWVGRWRRSRRLG